MLKVAEELCIVRRRRLPENNTETAGGRGDALPPLLRRIMMKAMSFSDTIFLFFLALILFGPKKLPGIARQAGRLLADLRRASNEFKSQIETEIAHLEVQKEAQKLEEQKEVQKNAGTNQTAASSAPH